MRRRLVRSSPSIQKIALGERQLGRRLADEQLAVGAHLIGFGIDLDVRQRVVQLHLGLAYPACVPDGQHHPVEPTPLDASVLDRGRRTEADAACTYSPAVSRDQRPGLERRRVPGAVDVRTEYPK